MKLRNLAIFAAVFGIALAGNSFAASDVKAATNNDQQANVTQPVADEATKEVVKDTKEPVKAAHHKAKKHSKKVHKKAAKVEKTAAEEAAPVDAAAPVANEANKEVK